MNVKIKRLSAEAQIPKYAHGPHEDAGLDLCSIEEALLEPGIAKAVATGLSIELPPGYEAQVRPRTFQIGRDTERRPDNRLPAQSARSPSQANPRLTTLASLAEALNLQVSDLFIDPDREKA